MAILLCCPPRRRTLDKSYSSTASTRERSATSLFQRPFTKPHRVEKPRLLRPFLSCFCVFLVSSLYPISSLIGTSLWSSHLAQFISSRLFFLMLPLLLLLPLFLSRLFVVRPFLFFWLLMIGTLFLTHFYVLPGLRSMTCRNWTRTLTPSRSTIMTTLLIALPGLMMVSSWPSAPTKVLCFIFRFIFLVFLFITISQFSFSLRSFFFLCFISPSHHLVAVSWSIYYRYRAHVFNARSNCRQCEW